MIKQTAALVLSLALMTQTVFSQDEQEAANEDSSPEVENLQSDSGNQTEQGATPEQKSGDKKSATQLNSPKPNTANAKKLSRKLKVKTADYPTPLKFDLAKGGVELPNQILDYDLQTSGGISLKLGPVEFNDSSFSVDLTTAKKIGSGIERVYDDANETALYFFWPKTFIQNGTLEVIGKTGTVIWSLNIENDSVKGWEEAQEDLKKQLGKSSSVLKSKFFNSTYMLNEPKDNAEFLYKIKDEFKFCLRQEQGLSRTTLCTSKYKVQKDKSGVKLNKIKSEDSQPRVLVYNEQANLKNVVSITPGNPMVFFAELKTGASIEFTTLPRQLKLVDLVENKKKPTEWLITGVDTKPVGVETIDIQAPVGTFTRLLGFESTIGDQRNFWTISLPKENPIVYMPGEAGGLFKQDIKVNRLPEEDEKPHVSATAIQGTYIDDPEIMLRVPSPDIKLMTKEFSIVPANKARTLYRWKFKAKERGELNRSYVNVESPEGKFMAYHELYKGYPREISTRLTGIVSSAGSYVIMGEVAFNYWFENLFGWENFYGSTQRWGTSIKAFQTFSKFKVGEDDAGEDVEAALSVTTADLKYRFTPGLWGRDESWGALLSYQSVGFEEVKASMLGAGFFWARSMPRIFDDLFNLLPIFRYPKWVDLEYIMYSSSLNSDVTLAANYALNFHGKVMWTNSFFGEAGFGMKQYAFTDKESDQEAKFATFYGTVGLGLNF